MTRTIHTPTALDTGPAASACETGQVEGIIGSIQTRQEGVPTNGRQSPLLKLAAKFSVEPDTLLRVLKSTIIKGSNGREATNEEIAAFCIVAQQYGLSPFTREIHAFADPRRGVVPIVGIDGWAHIVNDQPRFDGCEFEEVHDGEDFGVTCTMYVKDRSHPVRITEWLSECKRNTPPWDTMRRRMLRHKAFMQTARIAFSISGIYDEDEGRDIINGEVTSARNAEPTPTKQLNKQLGLAHAQRPATPPAPQPQAPSDDDSQVDPVVEAADETQQRPAEQPGETVNVDTGEVVDEPTPAVETVTAETMSKPWPEVLKLLWDKAKEAGVSRNDFNGGIFKLFTTKATETSVAQRIDLYQAIIEKRVDWKAGKIAATA